jgi:site-specific recombinase
MTKRSPDTERENEARATTSADARLLSFLHGLSPQGDPEAPPTELVELVELLRPRPSDVARALISATTGGLTTKRLERVIEYTAAAVARVEALVTALEERPPIAASLRAHLAGALSGRRARHLLSETGVPDHEGLLVGVFRRLRGKLVPTRRDRIYWDDLFGEVFSEPSDAGWVANVPAATWGRLYRILAQGAEGQTEPLPGFRQLQAEAGAAVAILAHRLASLGVDPVLRRYYAQSAEQDSPFLAQADELSSWAREAATSDAPCDVAPDRIAHASMLLDQCSDVLTKIRRLSNTRGTSVPLTTAVRRAVALIDRLRQLMTLLSSRDGDASGEAFAGLWVGLVHGETGRHSVRRFISESTDLVAIQVTEHAARTGEHYASSTRSEYWAMARSAAGAGVIVGFMALMKLLIVNWHLPLFWEASLTGLNYSAGFVAIHLLHFTVATKQPAMTAATVAATIDQTLGGKQPLDRLADLTAQVSRTQLVAIAGNVFLALPVSFALALSWRALFGESVIDAAKAQSLLDALHPWLSWAIPHAAIAGVCLFVAGLISGYFDNLCVYLRVPDLLRESPRVLRRLGAERTERLAAYVTNNLGAIAGNTAFGLLLAFVGFFGVIFGLPLDIRHVTFSTAYVAYSSVGLDFDLGLAELAVALLGVALIAATNLTVSFALALSVAMRARGMRLSGAFRFLGVLGRRFLGSPKSFFLPPKRNDDGDVRR